MKLNKYVYGVDILYNIPISKYDLNEAVSNKADELQREGYDVNTFYLPAENGKVHIIFEKYLMLDAKDFRFPHQALVHSHYNRR